MNYLIQDIPEMDNKKTKMLFEQVNRRVKPFPIKSENKLEYITVELLKNIENKSPMDIAYDELEAFSRNREDQMMKIVETTTWTAENVYNQYMENRPKSFDKWIINIAKDINMSLSIGTPNGELAPKWMRKYY